MAGGPLSALQPLTPQMLAVALTQSHIPVSVPVRTHPCPFYCVHRTGLLSQEGGDQLLSLTPFWYYVSLPASLLVTKLPGNLGEGHWICSTGDQTQGPPAC